LLLTKIARLPKSAEKSRFNKVFAAWENGALLSVQAKPAETALHRQQQTVNTS
jgi:hypothetical protein